MILREGSITDAPLLAEIHRECFPNYWSSEAFTDFFSVAGTQALIMEAPLPVGMLVWRLLQNEEAEILTLAVLRGFRRQGVARAMLETAMQNARLGGAKKMFLDVEDGNEAALALYTHHGFALVRRRKQYYRQRDGGFTDALVMQAKLA